MFSEFVLLDYFVSWLFPYSGDCHYLIIYFGSRLINFSLSGLIDSWGTRLSAPTSLQFRHLCSLTVSELKCTGLASPNGLQGNHSGCHWGEDWSQATKIRLGLGQPQRTLHTPRRSLRESFSSCLGRLQSGNEN